MTTTVYPGIAYPETQSGGSGSSFVGDYASSAALESAHPASSNDGSVGTVNGSLYISNGTDWVSVLTSTGGFISAEGAPLPTTYSTTDSDRIAGATTALAAYSETLYTKRVLAKRMVPTIRPGSGSVNGSGLVTFPTLPTNWVVPTGVLCKIYLPSSVMGTAGLYNCTITSATGATPNATAQIEGNPTTTAASFTSASTTVPLFSCTVPGGLLLDSGMLEITVKETHAGTQTVTRRTEFILGGYELGGTSNSTTAIQSRKSVGRIMCRGNSTLKSGLFPSSAGFYSDSSANSDWTYASVDTSTDKTLTVNLLASGAETVCYDYVLVEILPG